MTARRLCTIAAVAGLATFTACGEPVDSTTPANAPADLHRPLRENDHSQLRSLDDVTSNLPARPPAADPCVERALTPGVSHRC